MAFMFASRFTASLREQLPTKTFTAPSSVAVYLNNSTMKAVLYTDRTKAQQATNPIPFGVAVGAHGVDGNNRFTVFADPGLYDLWVNGVKVAEISLPRDPADPPTSTFPLLPPSPNGSVFRLAVKDTGVITTSYVSGGPVINPKPGPVTVTSSTTTTTSATLVWNAANGNGSAITGYIVSRDGVDSTGFGAYTTTLSSSTLTWTALQLVPNTQYHLTVTAVNANGNGPTTTATITTPATGGGPPPPPPPPSSGVTLGIAAPNGGFQGVANYESQLGIRIGVIGLYADRNWPPTNLADSGAVLASNAAVWRKGDTNKTLDWGVPLGVGAWGWIGPPSHMTAISSGSVDSNYNAMFDMLIAQGWANAYLRIGWEMQQQCASQGVTTAQYIAAFRRVATLARAKSSQFRIVFCPNGGDPSDGYYPGDAYVDVIASDTYYWYSDGTTANTINHVRNETWGTNYVSNFAQAHGKLCAIGEWGNTVVNGGLGDNPAVVDDMANWANTNNAVYVNYYDDPAGVGTHLASLPKTFAQLGKDFKNGGIATPPATTPLRIDCGNTTAPYTDGSGHVWQTDQYYIGGTAATTGTAVTGTSGAVAQSERWGLSGYSIPLNNGSYTLKLHFAEINPSSGTRTFQVTVNGAAALGSQAAPFNITTAAGGTFTEYVYTTGVSVTNKTLSIGFIAGQNAPEIVGIEVL